MKLDLQPSKGPTFRDVPGEIAQALNPFIHEKFVVYENWVGTIKRVYFDIEVQFSSGICKITRADTNKVFPDNYDRDPEDPESDIYFPGQKVTGRSKSIRKSQWVSGGFNEKDLKGSILSVQPSEVEVDWLASCFLASKIPPRTLKASLLTVLNYYHYSELQINDRIFITQSDKDQLLALAKQNQSNKQKLFAIYLV